MSDGTSGPSVAEMGLTKSDLGLEPNRLQKHSGQPIAEIIRRDVQSQQTGIKPVNSMLQNLHTEVKQGIGGTGLEIKVLPSLQEALSPDLLQVISTESSISHSDLYQTISSLAPLVHRTGLEMPQVIVRAFQYQGQNLIYTDAPVSERYRVVQVLEDKEVKKSMLNVRHLIIVDSESGKAVDLRPLLPEGYSLFYEAKFGRDYAGGFSYNHSSKFISYNELTSETLLVALFHELGHAIKAAYWEEDKAAALGTNSLDRWASLSGLVDQMVDSQRTDINIEGERGAWARGLQLTREVVNQGFPLKLDLKPILASIDKCLASYDEYFKGGTGTFRQGFRTNKPK